MGERPVSAIDEAIEATLLIGLFGLDDSNRHDLWVLGMRARRERAGRPMTDKEVTDLKKKIQENERTERMKMNDPPRTD